ncbi:MAG: hypothetical protein WCG67_09885, partial [Ferruginibacter sp.]
NKEAKVILVGITPGWTQMQIAYETIVRQLKHNQNWMSALSEVKKRAAFAGVMRSNLVNMLDEIGLNSKLGIESCHELFETKNHLLHATSYLKYPVFYKGVNYCGNSPSSLKEPLWKEIETNFVPEINEFQNKLIIPLGKSVKDVFSKLIAGQQLNENVYLENFPHPSGANAHRKTQFQKNKNLLESTIQDWDF